MFYSEIEALKIVIINCGINVVGGWKKGRILNEVGGRCTSRLGLEVVCFPIVVLKCSVACKLSDVTNSQNRQILAYTCKASSKLQCSYACLYLCKCLKKNLPSPVWQCQRWSFLQEDTVDKSEQLSSEPSWRGALELHGTGTAHDWTNKPFQLCWVL